MKLFLLLYFYIWWSIHTVGFHGKYEQFRSPNGTSQLWSFLVKF